MGPRIRIAIKTVLTAWAFACLVANSLTDPANLITFTGESQAAYDAGAKAAGYALIAAMGIAIQRIPGGEEDADRGLDLLLWLLNGSAAFLAAWFWLADETGNDPTPYLEEILVIGGVIIISLTMSVAGGAAAGLLYRQLGILKRTLGKVWSRLRRAN